MAIVKDVLKSLEGVFPMCPDAYNVIQKSEVK